MGDSFQCLRGLRRRAAAARFAGSAVPNPTGDRISLSCECCVLSGRGLCDSPITRAEES